MKLLAYMLAVALSIWVGIGGCSKKEEADRSGDTETLTDLFLDLAAATQQHRADTTALRQRHEALLQAYHISPAEVERALKVYRKHPEQWVQVLRRMSEKQKEEESEEKKKKAAQ